MATVTVVDDESGKVSTYQIVGEVEVDVSEVRISNKSPVGRALLGKLKGDTVTVVRPAGEMDLTVKKIVFR